VETIGGKETSKYPEKRNANAITAETNRVGYSENAIGCRREP